MNWIQTDFLYGKYLEPDLTINKIAAFDLDDTLIANKTRVSHGKFGGLTNWQFIHDSPAHLQQLYHDKFRIVIITNQKGVGKDPATIILWQQKLTAIATQLAIPLEIYCSLYDDKYRKPMPTFWTMVSNNIDRTHSFYCGDAFCDAMCHASTDYKFALNGKIRFFTPTEDTYKLIPIERTKWVIFYPALKVLRQTTYTPYVIPQTNQPTMIILIGLPASGKSTLAQRFAAQGYGYHIINQDTIGTRPKCLKLCQRLVSSNVNIVVDNTNLTKQSRTNYIDLTANTNYYIHCIDMTNHTSASIDIFHHNMLYRYYTRGIPIIKDMVFYMMRKRYQPPDATEKMNQITHLNLMEQIDQTNMPPDYYLYYY